MKRALLVSRDRRRSRRGAVLLRRRGDRSPSRPTCPEAPRPASAARPPRRRRRPSAAPAATPARQRGALRSRRRPSRPSRRRSPAATAVPPARRGGQGGRGSHQGASPRRRREARSRQAAPRQDQGGPKPTPKPQRGLRKDTRRCTYKYGTLQMGIRVKDGKIIDAWAVTYPKGDVAAVLRDGDPDPAAADHRRHVGEHRRGHAARRSRRHAWKKSLAGAIAKAGI